MKPQPTLRAEIAREIRLESIIDKYTYNILNDDYVADLILELISSRLPKEVKKPSWVSDTGFDGGYNQAIKDVQALLEGKE